MRTIREILRLRLNVGLSSREAAQSAGPSPAWVCDMMQRAPRAGLAIWAGVDGLDEASLEAMLYRPPRSCHNSLIGRVRTRSESTPTGNCAMVSPVSTYRARGGYGGRTVAPLELRHGLGTRLARRRTRRPALKKARVSKTARSEWHRAVRDDEDGVERLIAELGTYAAQSTGDRRALIEREFEYGVKHADRMDSPRLKAEKCPIGGGGQGGVCKSLVAARMKCSGMTRLQDGGQAILTSRG